MRRSTVSGRITSWYLLRLKVSRMRSATLQIKLTFSLKLFMSFCPMALPSLRSAEDFAFLWDSLLLCLFTVKREGQSSTDHLTLKWVICVKWQPFLSAPRLVLYRRISEQTRKDNRFSATFHQRVGGGTRTLILPLNDFRLPPDPGAVGLLPW